MARATAPEPVHVFDDGAPLRWQFSRGLRVVGLLWLLLAVTLAVAIVVTQPISDSWWEALLPLAVGIVFGWFMPIRPRINLTSDRLEVRTWYGQRVVDLADVTAAQADYYGLTIEQRSGPDINSSLGQKMNVNGWLGRVSKGDRWAAIIVYRARLARGEHPDPIELVGTRTAGNWGMALVMMAAKVFSGGR